MTRVRYSQCWLLTKHMHEVITEQVECKECVKKRPKEILKVVFGWVRLVWDMVSFINSLD